MDWSIFGLRQRPFRSTPDSASYYPATGHELVVGRLLQALREDEGLLLLTGVPGVGKTLLCHTLLERRGDGLSILLTNSHYSNRTALLQALAFEMALPYEGRGEQELRLAGTGCLLERLSEGKATLLVVDEAQHLSVDLLEELRML